MDQQNYPYPKYPNHPLYTPMSMPNTPQFNPNIGMIIPGASPIHPHQMMYQHIPHHAIGYRQQMHIGMYQRQSPGEGNNFMCLRRNAQFKRELDIEDEQQVKVGIKRNPNQTSSSYIGPCINLISIGLNSKIYNILYTIMDNDFTFNKLIQYKDEHWIFNFIINELKDSIDWTSIHKKEVPVQFVDLGNIDECNRILVRSDMNTRCCLPFELAKQISPLSFLKTSSLSSIFNDKNVKSTISIYETCTVSSPNFDFITSLSGQTKLNIQRCVIDCIEFGVVDSCLICGAITNEEDKYSITLENWALKGRFEISIRCMDAKSTDLLSKIAKYL